MHGAKKILAIIQKWDAQVIAAEASGAPLNKSRSQAPRELTAQSEHESVSA
jgi:hypothetical protein